MSAMHPTYTQKYCTCPDWDQFDDSQDAEDYRDIRDACTAHNA